MKKTLRHVYNNWSQAGRNRPPAPLGRWGNSPDRVDYEVYHATMPYDHCGAIGLAAAAAAAAHPSMTTTASSAAATPPPPPPRECEMCGSPMMAHHHHHRLCEQCERTLVMLVYWPHL
jgi:hypothetical protein